MTGVETEASPSTPVETRPAFSRQGQLAPGRGTEHRQKAAKILSYLRQRDPATARGLRSHAYGSRPEYRGKVIYARNVLTSTQAMEKLETLVNQGYKDRIRGALTESPEIHRQNTRAFRENVLDVVKSLKNSLGASAYAQGKADGPRTVFRSAARDAIKKVQAISKSPKGRDHSNRPEFQQANRDRQKLQYGYVKYPEVNYNKKGQANPETKIPDRLAGEKREVVNRAIERPIEVVLRARWSSNLERNRTTAVFNKQRVSQKLTPITSAGTAKEKTVESLPKSVKLARDYAAANPDYNGDHTKWKSSKDFPLKTWSDFDQNDPASDIAFSNYISALDQVKEFENDEHFTYLNTPIERAIESYAQNAADTAKEQGLGKKVAGEAFEYVFALAGINKLLRRRT